MKGELAFTSRAKIEDSLRNLSQYHLRCRLKRSSRVQRNRRNDLIVAFEWHNGTVVGWEKVNVLKQSVKVTTRHWTIFQVPAVNQSHWFFTVNNLLRVIDMNFLRWSRKTFALFWFQYVEILAKYHTHTHTPTILPRIFWFYRGQRPQKRWEKSWKVRIDTSANLMDFGEVKTEN